VVMNRSLIAVYMTCTFGALMTERMIIQYRLRYRLRKGSVRKHLLLVGDDGDEMRSFVGDAVLQDVQTLIVGRIGAPFDDADSASSTQELVRIGDIGDLGEMLHIKAVDQVMFFPPFNDPSSSSEALKECEALGIPACFYVHVSSPLTSLPRLVSLHRRPFFIFELAPKRPEMLALKYTFDTIAAAVGLLLISPLLLIVSLLILATMGRPIFFSQVRSGLFSREFRMLKFRTMVKSAESQRDALSAKNEMDGPVFKITRDPRVTGLGRFLRKWSIDELPQLFNVLIGDMSLVGPRPLPIREQKEIVGRRRRRLSMRPGITGLWQVSGRNDIDFEQWMRLDLEYVDHWSFWTDCKILLKTVKVVLTGKGAS
jgi:exopolysaccharide biosynthesis polyprenyl glycosylphosphotransferase